MIGTCIEDFLPDKDAFYFVQIGDKHWYGMPYYLVSNCILAGAAVRESRLRGRLIVVHQGAVEAVLRDVVKR